MNEQDRHFPDENRPRYKEPTPDVDRVDLLKKRLYSRTDPLPHRRHVRLKPIDREAPTDWGDDPDLKPLQDPLPKRNPFMIVFLIAATFFVGAAIYAALVWYGRIPNTDGSNVVLEITGPSSVKGGEPVAFEVLVANRNDIELQFVDLTLEFPEGTKTSDLSKDMRRQTIQIGKVAPGEVAKRDVEVVLYGAEQSVQEVNAKITYRLPGSVSVFDREKPFTISLTKSPLSAIATIDSEITSGQTLAVTVDVVSNSDRTIKGALLRIEYPFGFEPLEESGESLGTPGLFDIGDFEPGQKKQVRVIGRVTGSDGDQRTFRVSSGVRVAQDDPTFAATFSTDLATIRVVRPFLNVRFALDGSEDEVVAVNAQRGLRGYFVVRNDLDVPIVNVELDATVVGDVLSRPDIQPVQGYYRSADNVIAWDKTTAKDLATIEPGQEVRLGFAFSVKDLYNTQTSEIFRNPEIYMKMDVRAERLSERNVPESIVNTVERVVKINSSVGLDVYSLYSIGDFQNSGPVPPQVETPTTYTVEVKIENTSNALSDVVYVADLPPFVEWMDAYLPRTEDVSYDPTDRRVTWKVGDVPAGAGYSTPAIKTSFQLTLFPSANQVGDDAELMLEPKLTYYDRFSGQTIRISDDTVGTKITEDPMYKSGYDVVKDPNAVVR